MITREAVASQLRDYLQHRISRAALVDWAERAMMDEEFDDRDFETIREITGRLDLADVREFGPTWEDSPGAGRASAHRAPAPLDRLRAAKSAESARESEVISAREIRHGRDPEHVQRTGEIGTVVERHVIPGGAKDTRWSSST